MTRLTNPARLNRALDGDYTTETSRAWADELGNYNAFATLHREHEASRQLRQHYRAGRTWRRAGWLAGCMSAAIVVWVIWRVAG